MLKLTKTAFVATVLILGACKTTVPDPSLTASSASTDVQPLALRSVRHSDCGVETYREKQDPLCGEIHQSTRSAACGVESYNERADLSCPGSIPGDTYESRTTSGDCDHKNAPEPDACRPGYRETHYTDRKNRCEKRRSRGEFERWDEIEDRVKHCQRDQVLNRCSRPEFGVNQYKECRSPSHPLERYETCRRAEFGPETYKSCKVYVTTDELPQFLADRQRTVDLMNEQIVTSRGNYYFMVASDKSLACHIKSFEDKPLYKAAIEELKTKYLTITGEKYGASAIKCDEETATAIDAATCSDDSNACRMLQLYQQAKRYLSTTQTDLDNIRSNMGAQASRFVATMTTLHQAASIGLKPTLADVPGSSSGQ